MALGELFLTGLVITLLAFILAALPLYFSVKILGGKTSLMRAVFINIVAGILIVIIKDTFKVWGAAIAFLALVWIYHEFFRLKWIKAFFVWLFQLAFLVLFYLLAIFMAGALLGIYIVSSLV